MTTLFIDKRNTLLRADSEALVFYDRDSQEKIGTIPIRLLERVCIHGDVQLSASVLGKLGEHQIGVMILNGRKRQPALLMPAVIKDAKRRAAQFGAAQDGGFSLKLSKEWLELKISAQADFVAQAAMGHKHLTTLADIINEQKQNVRKAEHLDSLRGYEGAASAQYFQAWQHILPASLQFKGRNRRPPRDPFNVVLSLGYTILHFECVRYLTLIGLDPCCGFFHQLAHGRESLACDLMEPLRPHYDLWAADLFHQKILRPEDFSQDSEGACYMGKAGRVRYYQEVEHFLMQVRTHILQLCRRLLHQLAEYSQQDQAEFLLEEAYWGASE